MCFLRGHRTLITKELVAKSERFAKMVPKRLVFFFSSTPHFCLIDHSCQVANLQKTPKFAGSFSIHSHLVPPHLRLLADSILISGRFDTHFFFANHPPVFYHVGSFCSPRIFARRWKTQNPPWRAPRKFCRRPPLNLRRSVFRKTQLGGVCHGIWQRNNGALNQAKSSRSCPYSFWESCQQITRGFHCLAVISMGTQRSRLNNITNQSGDVNQRTCTGHKRLVNWRILLLWGRGCSYWVVGL